MKTNKGGFTLPGESGYEELTLRLAEKWGADIIRDSDGTELSSEILNAGYGIYSTLCIIRDHNRWAKENTDALQQTFLVTEPIVAQERKITVSLPAGFFSAQFRINDAEEAIKYWQVYDRTTDTEIPAESWSYDLSTEEVVIHQAELWHKYTVSFLAYRIWEEISMYNHTTNGWDKEHLMQIDPRHPKTQEYLLDWLDKWCQCHQATRVVRFTSLFYNFVWIWGNDERNRNLFTDWGSYDFTVSPLALRQFEERFGYRMTAEDFVNQGKMQATHMPPTKAKLDWMAFVNHFVVDFGGQLIELVHKYGKQAYMFYDDSWVGTEPYGDNFKKFKFDGIIKCVFSGYEVRLCAGVKVQTHELRLHPYLFPTGLGGAPTFMAGGDPAKDAREYWMNIRQALLRVPLERIGLGGYLHLTEGYPEFCDYIEKIAKEFRQIKQYHKRGKPWCLGGRVAVLHTWGKLRSWTLSGHFHETCMHDLIHVNEALAGMPVEVSFINFADVRNKGLDSFQAVINAGYAGSAWSGGAAWADRELIEIITAWVYKGGCFIGINEPSAVAGYDTFFRMAHVLGVDLDTGARVCHGKWRPVSGEGEGLVPEDAVFSEKSGIYLSDKETQVLKLSAAGRPLVTRHLCGAGSGVYLTDFRLTAANKRLLLNLFVAAGKAEPYYLPDNIHTEAAYYPDSGQMVVVNNSGQAQQVKINTPYGEKQAWLSAYDSAVIGLSAQL